MNATFVLFAAILAVLSSVTYSMYPQSCGTVTCPNMYICRRSIYGGTSECIAMQFQCPMMMGSNMWGFKRCNGGGTGGGMPPNGGYQQCNFQRGERCCNGVCVKGPALIPMNEYGNGGMGGVLSAAEGGESDKKPVAPKKP